jgi:hypothetical protein
VQSFNSIFLHNQNGSNVGTVGGSASGLLERAVEDIGRRCVFDGNPATLGESLAGRKKLEGERVHSIFYLKMLLLLLGSGGRFFWFLGYWRSWR